jgi:hypothetical protein
MAERKGDVLRSFAQECKKSKRGRKLKSSRLKSWRQEKDKSLRTRAERRVDAENSGTEVVWRALRHG